MAKSIKVDAKNVDKAITDILEEYFDGIRTESNEAVAEVAAETVIELQSSSPADSGKYAKGWRVKQINRDRSAASVVVHNVRYQLTHLLEHGHVKVIHGKVLGFTNPKPHIAEAEKNAINKLTNRIKEAIEQ